MPNSTPQPSPPGAPPRGTIPSAAYWRLIDRLRIPDADALELIGYAGRIGRDGKRPRFRLSTRQSHLAAYLPEIEAALQALGETPDWLQRRNKAAPFAGRTPLAWMVERNGEGMAEVLRWLIRAGLRKALR